MTRVVLLRRLLPGFAAVTVLLGVAACRSGAGVNKFSEPSLSAAESKRLGVFLKPVAATVTQTGRDGGDWQLEEAWLEERVERYEAIPIRKGPAGVRLCVRFTEKGGKALRNTARLRAPGTPSLEISHKVFSKDAVVFAFEATTVQMLPPKGVITISDDPAINDDHPGEEIVSVEYELPGAAVAPATESDSK